jgi:hypothetical protein
MKPRHTEIALVGLVIVLTLVQAAALAAWIWDALR